MRESGGQERPESQWCIGEKHGWDLWQREASDWLKGGEGKGGREEADSAKEQGLEKGREETGGRATAGEEGGDWQREGGRRKGVLF